MKVSENSRMSVQRSKLKIVDESANYNSEFTKKSVGSTFITGAPDEN
jgi:hypothetical protein